MPRLNIPHHLVFAAVLVSVPGWCGAAEYEWQLAQPATAMIEMVLQDRAQIIALKSGWKCEVSAPLASAVREFRTINCRKNVDLVTLKAECNDHKPADRATAEFRSGDLVDSISVGCHKRA